MPLTSCLLTAIPDSPPPRLGQVISQELNKQSFKQGVASQECLIWLQESKRLLEARERATGSEEAERLQVWGAWWGVGGGP